MEALQLNACSSIKQWTHTLEDGGKLKIISSEASHLSILIVSL